MVSFSDKWYCSSKCRVNVDDKVLDYSMRIMSDGLEHLACRHAVRMGDGPGMISDWIYDLLSFWDNNNYKYVIIAHYLIACKLIINKP